MKKLIGFVAALAIASTAAAALSKDEVSRLNKAAALLTELRNAPDNGIPEQIWRGANCVIAIPDMKKAAFVFGGEYGSGVMSCRQAGRWGAPIFMQLAKGSWGLQIGAQEIDLVLLVMNDRGVEKLLNNKVSLGADASIAAGPVGRAGSAATDAQLTTEMLAYSRTKGVFAGIDLSGGTLRPDENALERAYGPNVKPKDVVAGTSGVTAPAQARAFIEALGREVRATSGQK